MDARASVVLQAAARGWLERRVIRILDFDRGYNDLFSWSMSQGVPDNEAITDASRRYLYDLAKGITGLLGTRLNAGTVIDLRRRRLIMFGSYIRHPADSLAVAKYVNYAWVRHEFDVGLRLYRARAQLLGMAASGKRRKAASAPAFAVGDVLAVVAGFLDMPDWAAMANSCASLGFGVPSGLLRARVADRIGFAPRSPMAALLTYNAARSCTDWVCSATTVLSWNKRWATSHRHGQHDRVLHMWESPQGHVYFISTHGKCGMFLDHDHSRVQMHNMSRVSDFFEVRHVSIGLDGCICVVRTGGLSIFCNTMVSEVIHAPYFSTPTVELACMCHGKAYIVHGTTRKVYTVCTACGEPHMRLVYYPLGEDITACRHARFLKRTTWGVAWRSGLLRLYRNMGSARADEIRPRITGRGRIVYISDRLPSGLNAVLRATGPVVTDIYFTDGVSNLRSVSVAVEPMLRRGISTVGDMLVYRDRSTREVRAIRPESRSPGRETPIAFAPPAHPGERVTRYNSFGMYLLNGAVYVVDGGCTIRRILARVG